LIEVAGMKIGCRVWAVVEIEMTKAEKLHHFGDSEPQEQLQ
jgi:hypothetical protein